MAERINIGILTLFIILFSCEDKIREWDNPYDPRSNKSLWTPDSLDAMQTAENIIELTWVIAKKLLLIAKNRIKMGKKRKSI